MKNMITVKSAQKKCVRTFFLNRLIIKPNHYKYSDNLKKYIKIKLSVINVYHILICFTVIYYKYEISMDVIIT